MADPAHLSVHTADNTADSLEPLESASTLEASTVSGTTNMPPRVSADAASPISQVPSQSQSQSQPSSPAQASTPEELNRLDQLRHKFHNFDDKVVYDEVRRSCQRDDALNFVVQFSKAEAKVACDLEHDDFHMLMTEPNLFGPGRLPVRWINIWNPSKQKRTIETIGHHYGFSRRLILSIWAWDKVKESLRESAKPSKVSSSVKDAQGGSSVTRRKAARDEESGMRGLLDDKKSLAAGIGGVVDQPGTIPSLNSVIDRENRDTFAMMQSTIDYTSIDMGSRFVCFGANWLHRPPDNTKSLVPPKNWSWFALCDDGTIISIHESYQRSFSSKDATKHPEWEEQELESIRANTLKVFRQLSKQGQEEDKHNIMQLTSVRESMGTNGHSGREGASNIFYYLFENYSAAMLILRTAKSALEDISKRVLKTAEWRHKENTADIIPRLYKLNKELRQLHHLFKNYDTLIDKIINRDLDDVTDAATSDRPAAAWLSNSALNRFKRLKVQLQSLMLDTIRDYLDEKESLQTTYFNLTNQKDSQATERLTRSATALAKLSVFFLPISFMTSYFSIQVPELTSSFTKWSYWGSFAVIAGVSFISIFFFSKVLMFLSDWLDHVAERTEHWIKEKTCWNKLKKKKDEDED